jgi:hypothetical protein
MVIYVLSVLGITLSILGALLTGIASLIKTIKNKES